jgi:adenosylmethionine-8-amino-7-oxononanoate aminotransferase
VTRAATPTALDYPLWHGAMPMATALDGQLSADRFLVEGSGIRVRDAAGRWYLDARSGCWNLGLGHSARDVKDAIIRQLDLLPNATLLSYDRPAEVTVRYARALRDVFGPSLPYVRLGNTGSQMTETAVMLSRFARLLEGTPERTAVLSFEGSYHGMGPGGNAISGVIAYFDFCGPLMPGVVRVPSHGSWTDNVRAALEQLPPERVSCVILEPQMGVMGVVPDGGDLQALAALCRDTGIHFIADEVTTGFGRTGAMSRCLDLGIEPDMLVLGKNLTAGYVPVGALLVSTALYDLAARQQPPLALPAGSATDGHPVAAAAGLAVLDVYRREGILDNVRRVGEHLHRRLTAVHERTIGYGGVTGAGLMRFFPLLDRSGPWPPDRVERFRLACEDRGVLISSAAVGAWVVPPLVSTAADCDEIADAVDAALTALLAEEG